jgi:hypothetical protein
MQHAWCRVFVLGVAMLTSGCALLDAPQTRAWREAATAEQGIASQTMLDAVPFFPQMPYHCGPAALATALQAAGVAATPEVLAEGLFLPAREGSLQLEMVAATRRAGALATRIPGEVRAIARELTAGHPVLILQNLGLPQIPRWHYAVVVGHDVREEVFTLRSGTLREERISFNTLEHTWARSGHWAVVVKKPGAWPSTATVEEAEAAAVGFERVATPRHALTAYSSLLQRWPNRLVALMGQGNAQLALQDTTSAASSFGLAAEQHGSAAAWNNLAVARARLGDATGAKQAALRAVERAQAQEPAMLKAVLDTAAQLQRGDMP